MESNDLIRMMPLSRRHLITGISTALLARQWPSGVMAQTVAPRTIKLGGFEITIFSDGHMTVPTHLLASNVDMTVLSSWLAQIGQSGATVSPAANVTLVRTAGELVMYVDVGGGARFMPTLGKLIENMQAAGLDPKSVTRIVITHAHPDHLWGVLDDFDDLAFPNATYVIPELEWNFWMADDVASRIPEDRLNFVPGAQRSLKRIADRLQTIKAGQDIMTGIRAIDTSGHTPGHVAIEIAAGNETVIVLADALTHPTISFGHPEWTPAADHFDAERAVAMRKRLLDRLAADRSRIVGYHLPYPGAGIVERAGTAFKFVADR